MYFMIMQNLDLEVYFSHESRASFQGKEMTIFDVKKCH